MQVAMSPADLKFIGDIVEKDIHRNTDSCLVKLLMALKALPAKHRTPSEFIFNADYTNVPVNITVIPVVDVHDVDGWDAMADLALQSDGKLMIVRTQVPRGGPVPTITSILMRVPFQAV